jgi:hypothetical protein
LSGWGFGTEEGNETECRYEHCFAAMVTGTRGRGDERLPQNEWGYEGSGYWFRAGNIRVIDCYSANCLTYSFALFPDNLGNVTVPNTQGVSADEDGTVTKGTSIPMLELDGFEHYGGLSIDPTSEGGAFLLWNLGVDGSSATQYDPLMAQSVFTDVKVWHVHNKLAFLYPNMNCKFVNFQGRGSWFLQDSFSLGGGGFFPVDYLARDLQLVGGRIEGRGLGIYSPPYMGPNDDGQQTFLVENMEFENGTDILMETQWAVTGGGSGSSPRKVIIRNCLLEGDVEIAMTKADEAQPNLNYTALQELIVEDYQQAAGVDLQVYFTQQAGAFVLPTLGVFPDTAEGKTNTLAWSEDGTAFAGALLPGGVTDYANITGKVLEL